MKYMGDTRADTQILMLAAASKTISDRRFENDPDAQARLDAAMRGVSGNDAEGGLADARLAAARLMVEGAGNVLHAVAAKCVDAISPAGTPHAAQINSAVLSGYTIVKAAWIIALRAGDIQGKSDVVAEALSGEGDPCVHGVIPHRGDIRLNGTGAHE